MITKMLNIFRKWNMLGCPHCHCKEVEHVVKDRTEGFVTEESVICKRCHEEINYWAYGFYQFPRTKIEAIAKIINRIL